MLLQFSKFVNLVNAQGRTPTESDIDYFLDNFLIRPFGFLYPENSGAYIYSGNYVDKETGRKYLESKGASYKELYSEIKPLLVQKVKEIYSELGSNEKPFIWEPTPISESELARHYARESGISKANWDKLTGTERRNHDATIKAMKYISKVKSRIAEYNSKVIPFILRKTMHHPLTAGLYSTETGKGVVVRNAEGKHFTINSEEELQKYLTSSTINGFPAMQHEGLRYLWFQPSPGGDDIKMAVVDIDNPAGLPDRSLREVVRFVAKTLDDKNYPYIIMFTGNAYQVWFAANPHQPLGSIQDTRTLTKSLFYAPDLIAFDRKSAIHNKLVWLDDSVFRASNPIRMFFNLHYPTEHSKKAHSGLAAVPILLGDIEKFDPLTHAHPEYVLRHFTRYASIVSTFFDTAQIGQDYEEVDDIQAAPPCIRHDTKDPSHNLLDSLLENNEVISIPAGNIESHLQDEERALCYVKERGISAVMHYDSKGGIRVGGKTLTSVSTMQWRGVTLKTEQINTVLVTSNGTVIYDDYLCRDLKRYCEAVGISKVTMAGMVTKVDMGGNNEGAQAVRSIIERKDAPNPAEMKMLKFVPYKLTNFDGPTTKLPFAKQLEELGKIHTTRIIPTPYFLLEAPLAMKVKRLFKDLLLQRKVDALVVEGEETYIISTRRTIAAVIVGIDKQSTLYRTGSASIPPVFVAVTKKHSKFGPIYLAIAKAEIALKREDRERLKKLVRGEASEYEDGEGNIHTRYENVIPLNERVDPLGAQIEIVEPAIVVDVQYDDVSPLMMQTLPHHYRSSKRGTHYRAVGKEIYVTPLIGARVVSIREDLDHKRAGDISIDQDILLRSTTVKPRKGHSILDTLTNPRRERVRRNGAFFGVPESRRIWIDGVYDPDYFNASTMTRGSATGGRQAQVHLIEGRGGLPGEFERAYLRGKRGEPGGIFIDDKFQSSAGASGKYYTVTGMDTLFQTAVDDVYGYGGPQGTDVVTMGGQVTPWSYSEQVAAQHIDNKAQDHEDMKLIAHQMTKVPGDINSETPVSPYRSYDAGYLSALKSANKRLQEALGAKEMAKDDFETLLRANEVIENPVVKAGAWAGQVNEYAKEFEMWKKLPDPKEPWDIVVQGRFPMWQLPLLEKERLMRQATLMHALSEGEIDAINSRFGEPMSGDSLESILSDLYEGEDEDEGIEDPIDKSPIESRAVSDEGGALKLLKAAFDINKKAKKVKDGKKRSELYSEKARLIEQAIKVDPDNFSISEEDERFPGIVHKPSNFEIHAPKHLVEKYNIA